MADLRDAQRGRLAELMVSFGANVQPGQVVIVSGEIDDRELMRVIAARCYTAGALHVEVEYFDPYLKRARILYGGDGSIAYASSWEIERAREVGEQRCANIHMVGGSDPAVLEGLDPDRLGRDRSPVAKEWLKAITERTVNWSIGPSPTPVWAAVTHPELEPEAALDLLWAEVERVCRLDEPDPVAAWTARMGELSAVAGRLSERRFDSLHFEGPGTDLTVGLLPSSRFVAGGIETVDGIPHRPNLPSEEVFTTPDPTRTEGHVRSTKPLDVAGTVVHGLEVTFEGGRAVSIEAEHGAEMLRRRAAGDDGASRLGEVALVDGDSRIGHLSTVFYETLLDENAASHIALGNGLDWAVGEEHLDRINRSEIHIDFMIGSNEVAVTGVTVDGERVAVLRGGEWRV
ncbi:MAG: aminopeptidase [Gaiellales bacterium]|jgi:aminopeptidase|nr:aminopeptidase [Gaiellales bacterium]